VEKKGRVRGEGKNPAVFSGKGTTPIEEDRRYLTEGEGEAAKGKEKLTK